MNLTHSGVTRLLIVGVFVLLLLPSVVFAAQAVQSHESAAALVAEAGGSFTAADGSEVSLFFSGADTARVQKDTLGRPQKIREVSTGISIGSFKPASDAEPAVYREMQGSATPVAFTMDSKLTAASLDCTCPVEVQEWIGTRALPDGSWREPDAVFTATITIQADWVPRGVVMHNRSLDQIHFPGAFTMARVKSLDRTAVCTAAITFDGASYFDGVFEDYALFHSFRGGSATHIATP